MEFAGKIKKLFAYKDVSGWCSGIITQEDGKDVKFSGIVKNACEGFLINGTGELVNDPKYGPQIKVESATLKEPVSKDGIIRALKQYNGIGDTTARKIYDTFGEKSIKIIRNHPEKLIVISGITESKIEKIKESNEIDATVEKLVILCDGGITHLMAEKIYKKYGKSAVKHVREFPYDLIKDFKGIGFKVADNIARKLSISLTSPERLRAALVYILHEEHDKNGHMYLTAAYVQNEILKLIGDFSSFKFSSKQKQNKFERYMTEDLAEYIDKKAEIDKKFDFNETELDFIKNWVDIAETVVTNLASIISEAQKAGEVETDEDFNIYYKSDYEAELFSANMIGILSLLPPIKEISPFEIADKIKEEEDISGYELGIEQKNAIKTSLKSRISIITGGPGRGKTTIINTIIKIWNDDENVILCAPTGRAAQRMKEQTGHNASTIHSLIRSYGMFGEEFKGGKLFIVDESSMIDVNLSALLLKLIMTGENNLIFVGDADQLPPVGAGNFFNDLILSKAIPVTVLRTGYRNFGHIADNAFKVNMGSSFSKIVCGDDFEFTECDHEGLQKNVLKRYGELLEKYAPKDICLLSPMRTRSSCGTDKMNEIIRKNFNENASDPVYKDTKFALNDRVMCTKNKKDKLLTLHGVDCNGVFNGDCGTVIDVDTDENITTIEFDDGKIGVFDKEEIQNFTLAYAITIHKSQGSEYKAVILTITTEHFVMLQRNLLYTAITRAKDIVCMFGMKKAFNMAVRNTDYKLRNSKLKRMILKLINIVDSKSEEDIKELREYYFNRFNSSANSKGIMEYYAD